MTEMTGVARRSFKELISNQVDLVWPGEEVGMLQALAPRADGSGFVMVSGGRLYQIELDQVHRGWQRVRLPEGVRVHEGHRYAAFPWGPMIAVFVSRTIVVLTDGNGKVRSSFAVAEEPDLLDVCGLDLAVSTDYGNRIGMYRLDPDTAQVSTVVSPSRAVRLLFQGVSGASQMCFTPRGFAIFAAGDCAVYTFRRDERGRFLRECAQPHHIETHGQRRWLRVGDRLLLASPELGSVALAERSASAWPHPLPAELLNEPSWRRLQQADQVTQKAVAVATAAVSAMFSAGEAMADHQERRVAIVLRSDDELWVVTTMKVFRVDLESLRAAVRGVHWHHLDEIFIEARSLSTIAAGVVLVGADNGRWLKQSIVSLATRPSADTLAGEMRLRGLTAEDLLRVVDAAGETITLSTVDYLVDVLRDLEDDPVPLVKKCLTSRSPFRRRLGLVLFSTLNRCSTLWRVLDAVPASMKQGGHLVPARIECPTEGLESMAAELAAEDRPAWAVETALALASVESDWAARRLRHLAFESHDGAAREAAALGVLLVDPDDVDAADCLVRELVRGNSQLNALDVLRLARLPGRGIVRVAQRLVGGGSSDDAMSLLAWDSPREFFELAVPLAGLLLLRPESRDDAFGQWELSQLLRNLQFQKAGIAGGELDGLAALGALVLGAGFEELLPGEGAAELEALVKILAESGGEESQFGQLIAEGSRRSLYCALTNLLWQRKPTWGAVLRLMLDHLPLLEQAPPPPQRRTRGSVLAIEEALTGPPGPPLLELEPCVEHLAAEPNPAVSAFLGVWRGMEGAETLQLEIESLLTPGALSPFDQLAYVVGSKHPDLERVSELISECELGPAPPWFDESSLEDFVFGELADDW